MENKHTVDGYSFIGVSDYERAMKEKETIAYLSANTDMTNMKAVYKVYKMSVEKRSFQTVFGLNFMGELRKKLLDSGTVTEDILEPIPVGKVITVRQEKQPSVAANAKEIKKYKEAYEKARSGSLIKNFLILIMAVMIGAMLFITSRNQYSIFTYFTDYKENMRNELINEYEEWESQLDEREKSLEQREEQLKGQ